MLCLGDLGWLSRAMLWHLVRSESTIVQWGIQSGTCNFSFLLLVFAMSLGGLRPGVFEFSLCL